MSPIVRTLQLPGRVRLQVAEQGDPTGTPVIALHGVTDSWRSFEPVLEHLPRSLRVLALSQRGHGDSGRPARGYRPRDFADDVAASMDAEGLARAVVVGHSMGSVNALRFALDHPSRVLGLVLVGASPRFGANADFAAFWRADIAALQDPIAPAFVREFQQSTLAQPVPPTFLDRVVAESLKAPAQVWRDSFDGFMTEDLGPELPRIRVPTLIVWGRRDALAIESDQQLLHASIDRARLNIYDAAGHAPHWEEPQRFAHDLTAFVAATAASAAAAPAAA